MNQKKLEITYRDLTKEDYPAVEKIISDTWGFERKSEDKKGARDAAKAYLASCLTGHNFARAALCGGRIAGVLIGRCDKKPKQGFSDKIRLLGLTLKLSLKKEGREHLRRFRDLAKIDRQLLEEVSEGYEGEILLLAVARGKKGRGIGTRLWEDFKEFFTREGAGKLYVYTDSACDYKFYEKQGFVRKNTKERVLDLGGQRIKLQMYLYEYVCH